MFACSLGTSSIVNAGFWEFTMHSRANCSGFNESISWHFKHQYWLLTYTKHTNPKATWYCDFASSPSFEITCRSVAYILQKGGGLACSWEPLDDTRQRKNFNIGWLKLMQLIVIFMMDGGMYNEKK